MKKYFTFICIVGFLSFWATDIFSQNDAELERRENLLNLIGKYRTSHYYSGSGETWTGVSKRIYSYDPVLRPAEFINQDWSVDHWNDISKYVYSYYDNDSLSNYIEMESQFNQWYNSNKYTFTYNQNWMLTETLRQMAYGQDWLNFQRTSNTYNDSNRLTESLVQNWQDPEWINSTKVIVEYENFINFISYTTQTWNSSDSSGWVNQFRMLSSYDSTLRISINTSQRWEDTVWSNNRIETMRFDEEQKLIEQINEQERNGEMSPQFKTEYQYDTNDNLEQTLSYRWRDSSWQINSRTTFLYNTENRVIEYLTDDWDDSTATWEADRKATYQYTEDGNLTEFKRLNWSNGIWTNNQLLMYDYNLLLVNDETAQLKYNSAYPNPFNLSTRISYELKVPGDVNIRITDLQGREILNHSEKKVQGEQEYIFDGSLLQQGIYICNIHSGKESILSKLILNK